MLSESTENIAMHRDISKQKKSGSRGSPIVAAELMERTGIEPATSWLQTRRSPS